MKGKKVKINLPRTQWDGMEGVVLRTDVNKNGVKVHRVSFGETVAVFADDVVVQVKKKRSFSERKKK
jgi:hypothetical protein